MPWVCKDGDAGRRQTLQPQWQLVLATGPRKSENQGMEPGKCQEKGSTARWTRTLSDMHFPSGWQRTGLGALITNLPKCCGTPFLLYHPPIVGLQSPLSPTLSPSGATHHALHMVTFPHTPTASCTQGLVGKLRRAERIGNHQRYLLPLNTEAYIRDYDR